MLHQQQNIKLSAMERINNWSTTHMVFLIKAVQKKRLAIIWSSKVQKLT